MGTWTACLPSLSVPTTPDARFVCLRLTQAGHQLMHKITTPPRTIEQDAGHGDRTNRGRLWRSTPTSTFPLPTPRPAGPYQCSRAIDGERASVRLPSSQVYSIQIVQPQSVETSRFHRENAPRSGALSIPTSAPLPMQGLSFCNRKSPFFGFTNKGSAKTSFFPGPMRSLGLPGK